jgi:hypothetical protein
MGFTPSKCYELPPSYAGQTFTAMITTPNHDTQLLIMFIDCMGQRILML